jgi:transcriptional regulator with PAS, ATPase and Fis domain
MLAIHGKTYYRKICLKKKTCRFFETEKKMIDKEKAPPPKTPILQKPGFFRSLFDHMQIGVIVTDQKGIILYLNKTYAQFLGIDSETPVGKNITELVENSRMHIVGRTGKPEINYPHRFKDKSYLVHRIPIKDTSIEKGIDNGKVIAVLGLLLFDSATTATKLAEKLTLIESKLRLYEDELVSLRSSIYTIDSIVGESKSTRALKAKALRAATNNLPVVITGESGTGKELFAHAIHHASARRLYPFVKINCSAIPRDLIESELFGYDQGAFTGAKSNGKPGKFELAHHGSIFLDEIGDLPLEMQPKLLQILEDKQFERIGGTKLVTADFRLLAATNRNLAEMVEDNRFRKDLFYRLNVIHLHIPPLRNRREDIGPLVKHLLKKIAHNLGLTEITIEPEAVNVLRQADWSGNVRELSNTLERVASYLEGTRIQAGDLSVHLSGIHKTPLGVASGPLKFVQSAVEKEAIQKALESTGYNMTRTAKLLGIHRSVLYKKIKKHNLTLNR